MNKFKLSFCPKWNKKDKNGEAPVFLRITINGYRSELSTGVNVKPETWNYKANQLKDSKEKYLALKEFLEVFKSKAFEKLSVMMIENKEITPSLIKEALQGKEKSKDTLFSVFDTFIKEYEFLVEQKEIAKSTLQKYYNRYKSVYPLLQN